MTDAIAFLVAHRKSRQDRLPVPQNGPGERDTSFLDLSFVEEPWWPLLAPDTKPKEEPTHVSRRWFEICAITEVTRELKAGDLCIPGSDRYSSSAKRSAFRISNPMGNALAFPLSRRLLLLPCKANWKRRRAKRIENFRTTSTCASIKGILDVLADTEEWLHWTRHFGPISGHDSKLANPAERYLVTTFCYGFDFGPTQTSRSIRGLDRRQVAFVNQRHVTEEKLNDAITTVINGYNQFPLPKIWGLGKHASADGTKWDLHAQNLMSEYHLRYGGYGGIGYYMVSDMYIALFSRFTTCGSWEGHNILDYLVENDSDVQPDTIIPRGP